ncbi:hypothetical protein RRG08_006433 [Elysia crispata]|uniref:Uncharacterized protein n=1 Tax=Elysia crispata TaxID=231223 RepID=A0AAE0YMW9_9GAST|nr:hypothetical protein RRG08_006433 [Elysia crispata]
MGGELFGPSGLFNIKSDRIRYHRVNIWAVKCEVTLFRVRGHKGYFLRIRGHKGNVRRFCSLRGFLSPLKFENSRSVRPNRRVLLSKV